MDATNVNQYGVERDVAQTRNCNTYPFSSSVSIPAEEALFSFLQLLLMAVVVLWVLCGYVVYVLCGSVDVMRMLSIYNVNK